MKLKFYKKTNLKWFFELKYHCRQHVGKICIRLEKMLFYFDISVKCSRAIGYTI